MSISVFRKQLSALVPVSIAGTEALNRADKNPLTDDSIAAAVTLKRKHRSPMSDKEKPRTRRG